MIKASSAISGQRIGDSLGIMNGAQMSGNHGDSGMKNEGKNPMLHKTQGDLLQKLRQLRQWQQQQQEHLEDKGKRVTHIQEQEKRLLAVQEYQKRILARSGSFGSSPAMNSTNIPGQNGGNPNPSFYVQSHGNNFQGIPVVRPSVGQGQVDHNQNFDKISVSNPGPSGIVPVPKTVLLSPMHFQTTSPPKENVNTPSLNSQDMAVGSEVQNTMLLTQKVVLPVVSDEEISQFTESDGSSIGDIDGIRPIEDTVSEVSVDDENYSDLDNELNDNEEIDDIYNQMNNDYDQDDTLVEDEREEPEQTYFNGGDNIEDNIKPLFDDIPIKPGIGSQTKTFEELLNEKLQAEQITLQAKTTGNQAKIPVKRTFLRKGEGTARFGLKEKKTTQMKESQVQEKNGKDIQKKQDEQKGTLTRKIAANKQSSDITQQSHQQASNLQKKGVIILENKLSSRVVGPYPSIVEALNIQEEMSDNEDPRNDGKLQLTSPLVSVIEDSFQERMKKWDEMDIAEKQELNEFELLEEAAANCSLSSNSSTVLRILGKKKANPEIDRNNNMPGVLSGWRYSKTEPSSFPEENSRIMDVGFVSIQQHEVREDVKSEGHDEKLSVDNEGDDTLSKSDDHDDEDGENTLKAEDIVNIHSSLAVSDGFNDSETWEDHDVLDLSDVHNDLSISLNTSTPNDKSRAKKPEGLRRTSPHASSTPPTSALVTKLFPQLKTKVNQQHKVHQSGQHTNGKQSPKPNAAQANKSRAPFIATENTTEGATTRDPREDLMSCAVKEKLQELEKEIGKFREENAALHKLREEREKDLQELQRERSLFESHKADELEKLEKFKAEEERRLRRDKRVFEQYQKASRALPDKKEREEILALKSKINELQEEMKLRESRWSAATTRYKDRISNLEKENKEMKEEVRLLEKQNLELQRKDQQKTRELQQYKAFEKRKLTKPEELQAKSSSSHGTSQSSELKEENEHDVRNKEKIKSPSSSPLADHQGSKKPSKVKSDTSSSPLDRTQSSPPPVVKQSTREHTSSREMQCIKNSPSAEIYNGSENSSTLTTAIKKPSPPSKETSPSKTVRFKDDDSSLGNRTPLLPKEICHSDGKREVINADGSRVVIFSNGTRKEISADGSSIIVTFFNGDVKQVMPDERVVYYYAEAQTTHTTYPDGMEVLHFPSNQIEKHYPDGTKEIIFPDQTVKYLYQSGAEECVFADGTVERITGDKDRIVEFPNGQRETYTKLFKKREYPDGTVKTVFTDGRQETRYPSGRLRVKDSGGRLLVDTAEQTQIS